MSNNAAGGPTSPSRRSVVKGAAWAVPAVVVASAAPALAASPGCVALTLGGQSCKWPGGGQNNWGYRLELCFTNTCPTPITVLIKSVKSNAASSPTTVYDLTLVVPANGTACTEPPLIYCSNNSANFLDITYTLDGGPDLVARQPAPPSDCPPPSQCV